MKHVLCVSISLAMLGGAAHAQLQAPAEQPSQAVRTTPAAPAQAVRASPTAPAQAVQVTPQAPAQGVQAAQEAPAQAASRQAETRLAESLLEGLVLDDTVTPRGREFFRRFVEAWRELDARSRFTVTLREQPNPRQGSMVWVEYRGRQVLRVGISPNRALARDQAEQFAAAAFETLVSQQAEQALLNSGTQADLGPEEL